MLSSVCILHSLFMVFMFTFFLPSLKLRATMYNLKNLDAKGGKSSLSKSSFIKKTDTMHDCFPDACAIASLLNLPLLCHIFHWYYFMCCVKCLANHFPFIQHLHIHRIKALQVLPLFSNIPELPSHFSITLLVTVCLNIMSILKLI